MHIIYKRPVFCLVSGTCTARINKPDISSPRNFIIIIEKILLNLIDYRGRTTITF
jgi:hypothetical protein